MTNFWDHHGFFFLIFITVFPRLTLLFSSVSTGGLLWWLGFIIAPRILVAVLATISYLDSNPILVFISWVIALSGETTEKYNVRRRFKVIRYKTPHNNGRPGQDKQMPPPVGEVLDADYERIN